MKLIFFVLLLSIPISAAARIMDHDDVNNVLNDDVHFVLYKDFVQRDIEFPYWRHDLPEASIFPQRLLCFGFELTAVLLF